MGTSGVATVSLICVCVLGTVALADRPSDSHVRSLNGPIRGWIDEGLIRSPTFRSVVETVDRLPGVVYIDGVEHLRNGLSGALIYTIARTSEGRYLRVLLDLHTSTDRAIATMGHELQHAIEVLEDPAAVDEAAVRRLFERIAIGGITSRPRGEYETEAAVAVGARIKRELTAGHKPDDVR